MRSPSRRIIIEAGRPERDYFADLWRYRELFLFLSWRDIVVRYKQTAIGLAWSILRPLLVLVVFTVLFGKLVKLPSEGLPYPILVLAALLPWQFFANALTEGGGSLVANANLLTKIYFPRIIIPVSSTIANLIDLLIASLLLGVLMLWYGIFPGWRLVAIPFFLLLAFLASVGFGIWLAALNVKYRDVRYVVPFIAQFGLYISPVGFSSDIIPPAWRALYSLNPMVGVIDGFRWAVGGHDGLYLPSIFLSLMTGALVFLSGIRYFRKTERSLADII